MTRTNLPLRGQIEPYLNQSNKGLAPFRFLVKVLTCAALSGRGDTQVEEQLAELAAKVAALESASGGGTPNFVIAEIYYYITIPLMVIIHAGFLAYEMGASRLKNVLASGIKNILAFAFMMPTFYFFGWFVYWAWTPSD